MIKKIKLCAKGLYSSSRIYLHQIIIELTLKSVYYLDVFIMLLCKHYPKLSSILCNTKSYFPKERYSSNSASQTLRCS